MKIARFWIILLLSSPLYSVLPVGGTVKEEETKEQQDPSPNPNPNPTPAQNLQQREGVKPDVVAPQSAGSAQPQYPIVFPPVQERELRQEKESKPELAAEYCRRIVTNTLTPAELASAALKISSARLIDFAHKIRPRVILAGEAKVVPNETKYAGVVLKGEVEQKHEFEHVGEDNIKSVTASIEQPSGKKIIVKVWKVTREGSLQAAENIYDLSGKKAVCICFNKTNKLLYIGCEDGSIQAFDICSKKFADADVLPSYGSPVQALGLMHNDSCLVIKNLESTYVLAWDDAWPRIMLENIPYSKDYVFPTKIVRSHSDKSKLGAWLDGDKVYEIPQGYLQNSLPSFDAGKAAFIVLLSRIAKARIDEIVAISELYHSEPLKHFDAGIQHSFKEFLRKKAQERGAEIKETF